MSGIGGQDGAEIFAGFRAFTGGFGQYLQTMMCLIGRRAKSEEIHALGSDSLASRDCRMDQLSV